MSGLVFHHISEGIMAQDLKMHVKDAADSASVFVPEVKDGNILAADYVLKHLGLKCQADWNGSYASGNPVWGRAETQPAKRSVTLEREKAYGRNSIPDVLGMGARDAVYCLESRGIRVKLKGRGKVTAQTLAAGGRVRKGQLCTLTLQ